MQGMAGPMQPLQGQVQRFLRPCSLSIGYLNTWELTKCGGGDPSRTSHMPQRRHQGGCGSSRVNHGLHKLLGHKPGFEFPELWCLMLNNLKRPVTPGAIV